MRLFSYCIPHDHGAAPNPFWGVCTLTICKPEIRRVAQVGDWVVGVGSVNVGGKDYSGKLVYAMKVTKVLSLAEYDEYCRERKPKKIPNLQSLNYREQVGDCIYAFSKYSTITQRDGAHEEGDKERDLGGENSLLSTHFYYFGVNAKQIPDRFSVLVRQGRGYQSIKNEPIKEEFVKWLEKNHDKNRRYGLPQTEIIFTKDDKGKWCRSSRCRYNEVGQTRVARKKHKIC